MLETNHILITERNALLRRLTKIILATAGIHRVTEADSFENAITVLRAVAVDLLILDCKIDGVYAFDHIRQIRNGEAGDNRNIPIILLTDPHHEDWRDSYEVNRAISTGATICISKPFSIKTLILPVLNVLSRDFAEKGTEMHVVAPPSFAQFMRRGQAGAMSPD